MAAHKIPIRYKPDADGKIAQVAARVIREEKRFKPLVYAKILYCFRRPPQYDKDGEMIVAKARRLPPMLRDLFKYDFIIEVASSIWKHVNKRGRYRILWHELRHCQIELDDALKPVVDDCGRIKIHLDPHDLVIKTFKEEIIKFGAQGHERAIAKFLRRQARRKTV